MSIPRAALAPVVSAAFQRWSEHLRGPPAYKLMVECMGLKTLRDFVYEVTESVNRTGVMEINSRNVVVNRAMTAAIVEALISQSLGGVFVVAHEGSPGGMIELHNRGDTKRDSFDTLFTMLWVAKNQGAPVALPLGRGHASIVYETDESYEQALGMLRHPDNRHLLIPKEYDL